MSIHYTAFNYLMKTQLSLFFSHCHWCLASRKEGLSLLVSLLSLLRPEESKPRCQLNFISIFKTLNAQVSTFSGYLIGAEGLYTHIYIYKYEQPKHFTVCSKANSFPDLQWYQINNQKRTMLSFEFKTWHVPTPLYKKCIKKDKCNMITNTTTTQSPTNVHSHSACNQCFYCSPSLWNNTRK